MTTTWSQIPWTLSVWRWRYVDSLTVPLFLVVRSLNLYIYLSRCLSYFLPLCISPCLPLWLSSWLAAYLAGCLSVSLFANCYEPVIIVFTFIGRIQAWGGLLSGATGTAEARVGKWRWKRRKWRQHELYSTTTGSVPVQVWPDNRLRPGLDRARPNWYVCQEATGLV